MADLQRKIELQEPDDLRYLLANTRRVAAEKIDVALPPIEGEDVLRQKVEELVNSVRPPFCHFPNKTYPAIANTPPST